MYQHQYHDIAAPVDDGVEDGDEEEEPDQPGHHQVGRWQPLRNHHNLMRARHRLVGESTLNRCLAIRETLILAVTYATSLTVCHIQHILTLVIMCQ